MTDKLSKVQAEVLGHVAQGHKLYASRMGTPWLDKVPGVSKYQYKHVHSNTLYALRDRGYIERADTDKTPWWRRDYIITEKGRGKLDKEESDNETS